MSGPPPIADRPTEEHLGKNGGEAGAPCPMQCAEQPDTAERRNCVEGRIDLENLFGPRFNPSYFHLRGKGPVGAAL